MLLTQLTFYRKYGVWMLPQVATPAMYDLKLLEFPRESVYHYLVYDGELSTGPENDDLMLRNVARSIPVHSPMLLSATLGNPVRMASEGPEMVREYFKTHRRMHLARDLTQAQKDKDVPLVVNYAMLAKMYRYQPTKFAQYNRWRNLFTTMLDTFSHLSDLSNRQHYIFLQAPKVLPSVALLMAAAKEMTQATIGLIREPDGFVLLELWKWFNPGPEDEQPSIFHRIAKNKVHLLNFIYVSGGKWCVLNFGVLNSFFLAKGQKEPDPEFVIKAKQHVSGVQMAKRVLRLYMTVMEARSAALRAQIMQQPAVEVVTTQTTAQPVATPEGAQPVIQEPSEQANAAPQAAPIEPRIQINTVLVPDVSVIDEEEFSSLSSDEFQRVMAEQDAEIEEDLVQLDEISKKISAQAPSETVRSIINNTAIAPAEAGVISICDKMAFNGTLSAGEYRKYAKLATMYKHIKAPIGEGTLEEFLVIPQETLVLPDEPTIPDSPAVLDKTMLKSNLSLFDSKYVGEVLHKDIANTVMAVQKAGIAVTSYKVEKVEDILGGYEEHVVRLSPVIGQPSTIRFKVPIVKEDGSYQTNNVKYRLRRQRGD